MGENAALEKRLELVLDEQQRNELERLCRYIARPAIAAIQLRVE